MRSSSDSTSGVRGSSPSVELAGWRSPAKPPVRVTVPCSRAWARAPAPPGATGDGHLASTA